MIGRIIGVYADFSASTQIAKCTSSELQLFFVESGPWWRERVYSCQCVMFVSALMEVLYLRKRSVSERGSSSSPCC